ncbi:hypothetical protein B0H17DRAFT_1141107 [Mycena rosella]|uniref:Uncharacterized protein n=1 Tax=Mycena rosella TaxID=1033263 RepID=A0AAD7D4D8_MYCRO|nr:hypothetical protein B0H17DRAFT_1141107 [Mycena rosella]
MTRTTKRMGWMTRNAPCAPNRKARASPRAATPTPTTMRKSTRATPARKGKAARKMFAQRKASSDSASDKGGNVPPCPKSKAAAKTSSGGTLSVRARLVALVEKAKRKKVNGADTVKAASKRRREEEGDGARKKRRKDGEEEDRGEEVAGGKTAGKRKRNGDEDEGSQRKKKKEKEKESNARPAKKGATDTEPNRPRTVPDPNRGASSPLAPRRPALPARRTPPPPPPPPPARRPPPPTRLEMARAPLAPTRCRRARAPPRTRLRTAAAAGRRRAGGSATQ